jgi:hypothetical protein
LFAECRNLLQGPIESRQLLTGRHEVADVTCSTCDMQVGWTYLGADEPDQKYKIGKIVLELKFIFRGDAAAASASQSTAASQAGTSAAASSSADVSMDSDAANGGADEVNAPDDNIEEIEEVE